MNRRELIQWFGILFGSKFLEMNTVNNKNQKVSEPILRIAHLTDMHITPFNDSEKGVRKCLDQVLEFSNGKIDFVFTGGDLIMDALKKNQNEVDQQWEIWKRIKSDYPKIVFYHCIGNHDVWGLAPKNMDYDGKEKAMHELELTNPYYYFNQKNWHFIVLDSTHRKRDGSWYTARLDDGQFNWLKSILDSVPKNEYTLILSHIPILGATPFLDGDNAKTGDWIVPGAWMHIDAKKIIRLLYEYRHVKVCLSGHIHLLEKVVYNNIHYYCSGAVSGNWWGKTPYEQTANGWAYIELFENGTHTYQYIHLDWN